MTPPWLALITATQLAASEVLLVTSLEESSVPVFEVYDLAEDKVRVVEKVLGTGRSGLGATAGAGKIVESDLLVQYKVDTGEAWLLSRKPEQISGAANVQFGDSVCSVGGFNSTSGSATDEVLCWNPLGRSPDTEWVEVSTMNTKRFMPGSVVMDGKLYVAGGYDPKTHQFLSSVEVFDDVSKQWYGLPDLRHPRAGLALASAQGKLYAVGGWRDHKYSRQVEEYDPLQDKWSEVEPLQERRGKLGLVSTNNGLYAVGGVSGFRPSDQLDSIERYSTTTNSWQMMAGKLRVVRGAVSVVSVL